MRSLREAAWRPGESLAFALGLGERTFLRTAVALREVTADERWEFLFTWEFDGRALGTGEVVRHAAMAQLDIDATPLEYEVFAERAALRSVRFGDDEATLVLADGTQTTLALTRRPQLVLDNNGLGALAVLLSVLEPADGLREIDFFAPSVMAVRQTWVDAPSAHERTTGLGLSLTLDDDGRIARGTAPGDVSVVRIEPDDLLWHDLEGLRRRSPDARPVDAGLTRADVRLRSGAGALGAVVTMPARRPPVAGLVFIQGSGRQDRDGRGAAGRTGLAELADRLSHEGYATIRLDARGAGDTPYGPLDAGFEGLIEDARAAWEALDDTAAARLPRVLVGHSLGGLVAMELAARLAADGEQPAGVVLLATPGRLVGRLLRDQVMQEARRLGLSPDDVRRRGQAVTTAMRRLASGDDAPAAPLMAWEGMPHRLLKDVAAIDPRRLLCAVPCPVLLVQGTKDLQVSVTRDALRLIRAAPPSASAELRVLPDLDHLLMSEPERSTPARYLEPRPVPDQLVTTVREWLGGFVRGPVGAGPRSSETESCGGVVEEGGRVAYRPARPA